MYAHVSLRKPLREQTIYHGHATAVARKTLLISYLLRFGHGFSRFAIQTSERAFNEMDVKNADKNRSKVKGKVKSSRGDGI